MKDFTCPYCYETHDWKSIRLQCKYQQKLDLCCRDVVKDASGFIPDKDKKTCLKCKYGSLGVFCPNGRVPQKIPPDYQNGENLTVALMGAKASGKSNYIGVLVQEIINSMSEPFNCFLNTTVSTESNKFYHDNYYRPLYEAQSVIGATSANAIPPLLFPLFFKKQMAALTFYDTAGENMKDIETMEAANNYIRNAKGLIVLLDPLQIDSVREKLKGKVPLPDKDTNISEVLTNLFNVLMSSNKIKLKKGKIPIPIAVTFTKIDALETEGVDLLSEDSYLRSESLHLARGAFVKNDFAAVQRELRTILRDEVAEGGSINAVMQKFENYAFFGVTALGKVPNGMRLSGRVAPRRVLDPLLWILSVHKYIKTI